MIEKPGEMIACEQLKANAKSDKGQASELAAECDARAALSNRASGEREGDAHSLRISRSLLRSLRPCRGEGEGEEEREPRL